MPTTDFTGELRYAIKNDDFRHLFEELYLIHSRIVSLLTYKWMFFERPTSDERKWLDLNYGEREADKIINNCYVERKSLTNKVATNQQKYLQDSLQWLQSSANNLNEDFENLKKKYTNLLLEYGFPSYFLETMYFKINIP